MIKILIHLKKYTKHEIIMLFYCSQKMFFLFLFCLNTEGGKLSEILNSTGYTRIK